MILVVFSTAVNTSYALPAYCFLTVLTESSVKAAAEEANCLETLGKGPKKPFGCSLSLADDDR